MSCQVEQLSDCGDISTLARALFISDKDDETWFSQCMISLSSCGNLLAVGYKDRLCLLTSQWISTTDSNTYLISWSGTLPSQITAVLVLAICPSEQSSQNGPDWFCILVGFKNGNVGFYTNTGHLLLLEKLEEKPVMKISCHTGTYGTLPDDVHVLFQHCESIISGATLFQTLRNAKGQIAKVQAGVQEGYTVDSHNIHIKKWNFNDQEMINDAAVVGLELKNTYDHLLAASTYGGYDTWYRSVPPVNTLILATGAKPYLGFHYALEGGVAPPLQDVARAVANKIKSALPGWLGGASTENSAASIEPVVRSESLTLRAAVTDSLRQGSLVCISPDRRLAAVSDALGRVAVVDLAKGYIIRLFKGHRDAQCAFLQVFEQDSGKPQLSVIKEIRRAIFLVIYNPKKGLIDIRLMQSGARVAVFTATKNGVLIYNTCGLVGAEKSYTHKKLNLPEFQCILMDPDGRLKTFHIPFYYALDEEHSERSKDLHVLRELREYIKKTPLNSDVVRAELLNRVMELQTMESKKHCLQLLIRHEVSPKIITQFLSIFWENCDDYETIASIQRLKVREYFKNLALITLFYRRLNNEDTNDMRDLIESVHKSIGFESQKHMNEININEFHLLEDDNCILERLLILAQQNDFKDHQLKVRFADSKTNTYKEFISCFVLDEVSDYISFKADLSGDKLGTLASGVFHSIFALSNKQSLYTYVKESKLDSREILKLVFMNIINMRVTEIGIELIEKCIEVIYYLSSVSENAFVKTYNETSPWWQNIRDLLIDMPCPLKSMILAMACKAVGRLFESQHLEEDAWESITNENARWGILIGKLEDISILSIILAHKDNFKGTPMPKLELDDMNINLKYIYSRGKGSITELIAKWLCSMGVCPEAIVANELILQVPYDSSEELDDDGSPSFLFIENNRIHVDENPEIFKWLSLLKQQFPLSTSANFIIANMCWEYAMTWQKDMQLTKYLTAVVKCLEYISDLHLRRGLFHIIWSTYIKNVFEMSCRLVNKVGKIPKESLCMQDVGLSNSNLLKFLEISNEYLENFKCSTELAASQEKQKIEYEKIWDESSPSLVEVAQGTSNINIDILKIIYQISCSIYYQCYFNIKYSKPLDMLYDAEPQFIFDSLTNASTSRKINLGPSEKVRNPRKKFLTKIVRAAVETISCEEHTRFGAFKTYNNDECVTWMQKITALSVLWDIDDDFVKRQQVIALYHLGFDTLAEDVLGLIKNSEDLLDPLLAITTQRLKRSLEQSHNQPEWIVTVPPHIYKRIQNIALDTSIPAHPSLVTTKGVLQKLLLHTDKKSKMTLPDTQDIKLVNLFIETCDVLFKRHL